MAAKADYSKIEHKAKNHEELQRIKKNIADSYMYSRENCNRFREFRKYVFRESINDQQRQLLQSLNRPPVEFNILEAYVSRLVGEFAMQEPSIEVRPAEGVPVNQKVIDFVEGHIRHLIDEANKNSFANETYKDGLSGGFSVAKIWTDYSSPMSFNQDIFLKKAFDPTLCGFDPLARESHKGDGHYCFDLYPMIEDDFRRQFPNSDFRVIGRNDIEGFNWSYRDSQNKEIILVADYYEKKKKRVKIVKLADGRVMTAKNYKKFLAMWEDEQYIEVPPEVVGNPRMTTIEVVCKYRLTESEILEYTETDYGYLPLVFFDGNSINLSNTAGINNTYQMTRPYVYHARGIQDLKNFAGQSLANYLENLVQSKYIIKKEALPQEQDYLDAIRDIQRAGTIVVNAFNDNNPEQPIPEPIREIVNPPAPPEIMGAFQITDPTTQTILGSFASNLSKNDNDLSGKAVIETATQGNAAAMPHITNYLAGLEHVANVFVDLIPKYLIGKRSIPVLSKQGERGYQSINDPRDPESIMINYDERALKVTITAGVNFQVQKTQALQQITAIMQASPKFAEFMNSDVGLPILVDNLQIYGADRLQEAVPVWIQQQQQQQQQAMQMQQQMMQQDPQFIKAQAEVQKVKIEGQKMQQEAQQQQVENQFEIARIANEKIIADAKVLEAEAKITQGQVDSAVRLEESQTSLEVHALDAAAKMSEVKEREHKMHLDTHASLLKEKELEHKIKIENKPKPKSDK